MLSIRRIEIDVPCSIVTFCDVGGGNGGGVDGFASAEAASCSGSACGEFSDFAPLAVEPEALSYHGEPSDAFAGRRLLRIGLLLWCGRVAAALAPGWTAAMSALPT